MQLKRYLLLCFLACLFFNSGVFAQDYSIISAAEIKPSTAYVYSNYNTLESCVNISAREYPVQIARFPIDRPGFIKKIVLHLDGVGTGKFTTHIYGHESGTNYPALSKDLVRPIRKKKRRPGYQKIVIKLKKPVFVENDQFYITLDNFTGDFGLKQDSTFYQAFCCSEDGANFYPTLLINPAGKFLGENCYLTMDVHMELEPAISPMFEEVSQAVGIPLNLSNEHIAWGDLDGDNWLDLIVGGRIYKNEKGHFKDITNTIIEDMPFGVRGAAFVDMNNDGQQDILLFANNKSLLLLNDGQGEFRKKQLRLPPLPALHAFSIADINQDYFPDLVVAQLWNPYPVPHPNYLFLNNHQNDFEDITRRLYPTHSQKENFPQGLDCLANKEETHIPNHNKNRRSRGCQFTDIDLDGDVDLYITNYFLEKDEYYLNDGHAYFTATPPPKAVGQSDTMNNHGTGVDWYDFDNDGDFDLLLPQLAHPRNLNLDHRGTTIFRNDNGKFTDLKDSHGIKYEETHAGATFGDVNNDGLVDIITTVYYGCRYVDLYLQRKNHRFQLSTPQSGLSKLTTGNDACFVDFNNDGLLDLAMGEEGKFRLFKNKHTTTNSWIKIQLKNTIGNHFGIGARVKVYTPNQVYTQEVNAGRGQRMQKPYVLHFGLGQAQSIEKIVVFWPNNQVETYRDFQINQRYIIKKLKQ